MERTRARGAAPRDKGGLASRWNYASHRGHQAEGGACPYPRQDFPESEGLPAPITAALAQRSGWKTERAIPEHEAPRRLAALDQPPALEGGDSLPTRVRG